MSRPEFRPDDSTLDPAQTLEQHILAGLPLDLALDLALNELVVRAAAATHANAAALALLRAEEMVCRAATGEVAPDLGIPLNSRDGLSGACLQTRQPQLSVDTEFDPRVDPAISRGLGIRSILIVPVFDSFNNDSYGNDSLNNKKSAPVAGVLEVFSTSPAAFSNSDQKLLEGFAEECARIRRAALELGQRPPTPIVAREFDRPGFISPGFILPDSATANTQPARRAPTEAWTLAIGGLAVLVTIAVSFLIGSRIGWLRLAQSGAEVAQPTPTVPARQSSAVPATVGANQMSSGKASPKASARTSAIPTSDELVVYEKGKVIFRMKPAPAKPDSDAIVVASSTTKIATTPVTGTQIPETQVTGTPVARTKPGSSPNVWLSPTQAESRLLARTEPDYPAEARAAHRAGNVVLEIQVAEDGSVSDVRALSGDPILAAAASDAVRNWRYRPYRQHDHPAQFQTDVTLSFTLPD